MIIQWGQLGLPSMIILQTNKKESKLAVERMNACTNYVHVHYSVEKKKSDAGEQLVAL